MRTLKLFGWPSFVFIALFCAMNHFSLAQTFSKDRALFVKEINKTFSSEDFSDIKEFRKAMEPYILNEISTQNFDRLVNRSNEMFVNRFPNKDVFKYVHTHLLCFKNNLSQDNFEIWHELLDFNLAKKNQKHAKEYLNASYVFFEAGVLAEQSNFYWAVYNSKFNFINTNSELLITFDRTDLVCRTTDRERKAIDSMLIIGTTGVYNFDKAKWEGSGGIVTWEKVGLSKSETYAELKSYHLKTSAIQYLCDTVILHTPYFNQTISGSLIERTGNYVRPADRKFPQFTSFDKQLEISNIIPEVNYTGGFALRGAIFVGLGTSTQLAKVIFFDKGKLKFSVASNEVNIDEDKVDIVSGILNFKVGDKDSIHHSGINFAYRRALGQADFSRTNSGRGMSPFYSSYHELDIYVDRLQWQKGDSSLLFLWRENSAIEQRQGRFESTDFFNGFVYDKIGGNSNKHPLVALHQYATSQKKNIFTEGEAATALGFEVSQVKALLLDLAGYGFILYETENNRVTITPKTTRFVQAKSRQGDFDNIIFECDFRPKSIIGKSPQEIENDIELRKIKAIYDDLNAKNKNRSQFAKLNLSTLELIVEGLERIPLSDAKKTNVFPSNNQVIVQKNRNFLFSGWVNSGKLEINVLEGLFDYSNFSVLIGSASQTLLNIAPLTPEDGKKSIISRSAIHGVKGTLLIDEPSNKSGSNYKKFGNYPRLISKQKTKVFYNDRSIHKGAYDSTRFYFQMEPFELDSLMSFSDKDLRLSGEMISADIFPAFKQELKIMPDYSFGFAMKAPDEGFDFYGKDTKYKNEILLSNNGLQGSGTIEYVTSIAESIGLLTFMPDSTIGTAKFVTHPREKGVQMPDVTADEAFITYVPKNQLLKARSVRKPMLFFDGEAKFLGTVFVRPDGFRGSGKFNLTSAIVSSHNYAALRWQIVADTSNFSLRNIFGEEEEGTIAFGSENVRCVVDFENRRGDFVSNQGESIVNFPLNQFLCKMDKFSWSMDVDLIELEKNPEATTDITIDTEMGLSKSNFYSTHPKQDSLDFLSLKAKFDYKSKIITCDKVSYIDVADARIFPSDQRVIIRKKAELDPFKNAEIIANYITKYHRFKNADVSITGKRAYQGSGEYEYVDMNGESTKFYLKNIGLDASFQTVAKGNVPESARFMLSPKFEFKGDFAIFAAQPTVAFQGATRLVHDCSDFSKNWMVFDGPIDSKNVQIPIQKEMKSDNGTSMASGIAWSPPIQNKEARMYPVFLSELIAPDDKNLISATGFLEYNYEAEEYRISSKDKLSNRQSLGNYLALHLPTCGLNGDGAIDLGIAIDGLDIDAVGFVNYNPATKQTTMNLSLKLNMLFEESILEKFAERISTNTNLSSISIEEIKQRTTLEAAFSNWFGVNVSDKFLSEYALKKTPKKMPKEMYAPIILSGITLFSIDSIPDFSGLSSFSDKVCLVSCFGQPVMKYVPAELAFYKTENSPNAMGLYFYIPGVNNYFFYFEQKKKTGELRVVTSDQDMKGKIVAIKAEKRKAKNYDYDVSSNQAYYSIFKQLIKINE